MRRITLLTPVVAIHCVCATAQTDSQSYYERAAAAEQAGNYEAAIRELQQITGVVDQMQEPPAILDADWRKVAQ